jgi:hypothetical protein
MNVDDDDRTVVKVRGPARFGLSDHAGLTGYETRSGSAMFRPRDNVRVWLGDAATAGQDVG